MLLLLACSSPTPAPKPEVEAVSLGLSAAPEALDFGEVVFGATATFDLEVTNTSTAAVVFAASADGLDVDAPDTLDVGGAHLVTVVWTPASEEDLAAILHLTAAADEETFSLDVPVSGTVGVPNFRLERESVTFGEVEVGCAPERTLGVYSTGNAPLTVSAWTLDEAEVSLQGLNTFGDTVELPDLPWVIAPRQGMTLVFGYAPPTVQVIDAHLVLTTNDPDQGTIDIPITAAGVVPAREVTFVVESQQRVTAIIAVNEEVAWGPSFHDKVFAGLPALFETLAASGRPYRVAFTSTIDGAVGGDVPYLDETTDPAAIADLIEAMVPNTGTDNDELLPTLEAAIVAQSAWLFEDEAWSASRLSLVGVNYDMEQSSGSAVGFVEGFQAHKEDPSDVVVHAIAGEYPSGCGMASPSELFWTAAELTGGIYLSICQPDWTPLMEELAEALLGDSQHFTLDEADPTTIEVWVDGVANTDWTYTDGELLFDTQPPAGSEVRVTYVEVQECE